LRLARGETSLELVVQVKNVPSCCRLLHALLGTEVLLVSTAPVIGFTGRKIVLPASLRTDCEKSLLSSV